MLFLCFLLLSQTKSTSLKAINRKKFNVDNQFKITDDIADRLHQFILTKKKKTIEIGVQDIMTSMKYCEVSLLGKVITDK